MKQATKKAAALLLALALFALPLTLTACGGSSFFETHYLSYTNGTKMVSIALSKQQGEYESGVVAKTVTFTDGRASVQDIYRDTEDNSETDLVGKYDYSAGSNTLTVNGVTYRYTIEDDKMVFETDFFGAKTWDIETY